jgi:hypothetical protein
VITNIIKIDANKKVGAVQSKISLSEVRQLKKPLKEGEDRQEMSRLLSE